MNILIADAQAKVRFGLRVWLEQQPGWRVCGEAANEEELLAQVIRNCPDILLIDWELPGAPVLSLLQTLRAACPNMQVIYMSGRGEYRLGAIQAGAAAFMDKVDPPEKLLKLIEALEG